MNQIIFGILILLQFGCKGQHQEKNIDEKITVVEKVQDTVTKNTIKSLQEIRLASDTLKNYQEIKNNIKQQKANYTKSSTNSLSTLFKSSLLHRILPHWEGTEWSFEGHTSIPKKGKIACGYFVSTTLKHIGVNLNRYKLAQQSPFLEAKSLALDSDPIEISENSVNENITKIRKNLKEGIHFIGFDSSHVGYILKENEQLYLIHSNYIDSKGVEIEKIENSIVFASYDKFYLSELSTNENFLKHWIQGIEVKIVK
ncbi:hypothetical protein [uncultured Aquimarina sp.]|uniref:hypothetical protein n=1 Tax=uncultured Aquimarina sp. TaxID=575652 RepID=UPI0026255DCD|nr:hypothetical protein [uncultured Aquimarina sp.]